MPKQTYLSLVSSDLDGRPEGQTVGYVRVSSADQNPARQYEAIGQCDKTFEDRISGKSRANRTGLADMLSYVREHDTIRIASLDRLGRDTRDLHALVDELTAKGCTVVFVSEGITFSSDPYGSAFYFTTGFHGIHVTLGLLAFLLVIGRIYAVRNFTHKEESTAIVVSYYWHFVDVVWIGLFLVIYVLK